MATPTIGAWELEDSVKRILQLEALIEHMYPDWKASLSRPGHDHRIHDRITLEIERLLPWVLPKKTHEEIRKRNNQSNQDDRSRIDCES